MSALYDKIGVGYDTTRRPDPRIAAELLRHLGCSAGARVFDLACGSGNYTRLMAVAGLQMTGLDLSLTMLAQASQKQPSFPVVLGNALSLPFQIGAFDAAMTTLTIHHMTNHEQVFAEVRRVIRPGAQFVIFTILPEQQDRYWLGEYWPAPLQSTARRMPGRDVLDDALMSAGFEPPNYFPWAVPPDLTDLFWYAGKDRPEIYFDPRIRAGVSAFAADCSPEELHAGLAKLRADLDSGRWKEIRAAAEHDLGDCCFVVATARG